MDFFWATSAAGNIFGKIKIFGIRSFFLVYEELLIASVPEV